MSKFTENDLISMQNPYQQLITEGNFTDNVAELNALKAKDKVSRAISMILDCPEDKLNELQTFAAPSPKKAKTFAGVLSRALRAERIILALKNPQDLESSPILQDEDFVDLLNEFRVLVTARLAQTDFKSLAENLVIYIDSDDHREMQRTINNAFEKHTISTELRQAMQINRQLAMLKGEHPSSVFLHPEFNPSQIRKYPALIQHHLENNIDRIAASLAQSTLHLEEIDNKIQSLMLDQDNDHPFHRLNAAFNHIKQSHTPDEGTTASSSSSSSSSTGVAALSQQIDGVEVTKSSPPSSPGRNRHSFHTIRLDEQHEEKQDKKEHKSKGCVLM